MPKIPTDKRKHLWILGGVVIILVAIGIFMFLNSKPPVSAEVTYTNQGFSPSTLNVLINPEGTQILINNASDKNIKLKRVDVAKNETSDAGTVRAGKNKSFVVETAGNYGFFNEDNMLQRVAITVIDAPQPSQ